MTTIIFFMSVLDVRIPRILLRSVWKTTCKVQNTYNGEPFDFIFNPWNVFSGIVDRTFCFDYIYSNVLFVLNRACDKKGVRSGSGRKKKKWSSDLFLMRLGICSRVVSISYPERRCYFPSIHKHITSLQNHCEFFLSLACPRTLSGYKT